MMDTEQLGLSAEVLAGLSAPVPASEIATKNQGGTTIQFTSDKFVMRRLNEVVGVGGWQDQYVSTPHEPVTIHVGKKSETLVTGQIVCNLTVLGVTKSGVADMEIPQNSDIYGTPATNAQARAFKRAAMKFGIASELWDKDVAPAEDRPAQTQANTRQSYQAKPAAQPSRGGATRQAGGGNRVAPSAKQVEWLHDVLKVPTTVVNQLSAGGGKDSEASRLMNALFQHRNPDQNGYDRDPLPHIEEALGEVGLDSLVPLLNAGSDIDED